METEKGGAKETNLNREKEFVNESSVMKKEVGVKKRRLIGRKREV